MPSYLVRPRGQGFAFRVAVPKDLRDKFPSPRTGAPRSFIVEGLNTDSITVARAQARDKLTLWTRAFEKARNGSPLTLAEIKEAAAECYAHTLQRMATDATIMRDLFGGMSGRANDPEADETVFLTSGQELREKALADGDYSIVVPEIEAVQRRYGLASIDPASPAYSKLAKALLRAQLAAIRGRMSILRGQPTPTPDPASFLGADGFDDTTLQPRNLTLSAVRLKAEHGPWSLFERWVAEARPATSTVNRWRAVFLNLRAKFTARDISDDDAREWARGLVTNARSPKTVREVWVTAARTVYNWAVEQKLARSNPFAAVKITVPEQIETRESKAFTAQEAETILRASLAIEPAGSAFKAAQRWVPWLQAYSGARAGEISQLRGQDVLQQDGVWVMKLTPEAGTVKTRRPRVVPLHKHLIAQGFLKFVKTNGQGPLFYNGDGRTRRDVKEHDATNPSRPRAVKTRERLAAWIRELGVDDPAVSPTHGWRHLFKQIAEGAGISERMSDYITGHAPATIGRQYGAPKVPDIAAALAKFPRYKLQERRHADS